MRCRYLVPTLGLMAFTGAAQAVEVGGVAEINGYVDSILAIEDQDSSDDTVIDFSAAALVQTSATIGDDVALQIDLLWDDANNPTLVQAYSTWALTDEFTMQFGKSISWLGFQTRYATGLYRINGTPYIPHYYGADTVGVWGIYAINEDITATVTIVDDVHGPAVQASDALGFGADLMVGLEGFGTLNVEMSYDMEGADYFDGTADADADALGFGAWASADQIVEDAIFAAEAQFMDYDTAASMAFMVMGNYQFHEMASATLMASYWDPNDDADDDELFEIAAALLTTPTGDGNFAVNAEVKYIDAEDDDLLGVYFEVLAVIP